MKTNFYFSQSGNLYGITCRTKKARKWMDDNVSSESWQWMGNTMWIDIRYAEEIIDAISSEFN